MIFSKNRIKIKYNYGFNTKKQKVQEAIQKIITEASENEAFKKNLIDDPKSTLELFFGKSIDTNKKIKVIDQTDSEYVYINIPAKPNIEDVELNEEQLEAGVGGGIQ